MQLKNLLNEKFSIVMANIRKNNESYQFNVNLPDNIPLSQIVKNLNENINNLLIQRESIHSPNSNNINYNSMHINNVEQVNKVDIISIKIGKCIIYGFVELYNKYISHSSKHCINISSRIRSNLIYLFDSTYFSNNKDKINNTKKQNSISIWNSIVEFDRYDRSVSKIIPQKQSFIKQEFEK